MYGLVISGAEENSVSVSSPEGEEPPADQGEGEGEEWEQVGPKNKSTITRQVCTYDAWKYDTLVSGWIGKEKMRG